MAELRTFRDRVRDSVPPWLRHGVAEKVLYSIAIHLDGLADALTAGVKMRFPGLYSGESLPVIGRERRIRRGRVEVDAVYASRLTRWLDDHRRRGGPYALLAQLHASFAPENFPIDLVYYPSTVLGTPARARRFQMDVDGNVVRDDVYWLPDNDAVHWARWWLLYFWPDARAADGIWDDPGEWDPDPDEIQPLGVWDSDLTPQEVADLRLVPRDWNAQHPFGYIVLLVPGAELWDYPPGEWDDPGDWNGNDTGPLLLGIG